MDIDPTAASSAKEYGELLRKLRLTVGLSGRQLSQSTKSGSGHVHELAASSISDIELGKRLPRSDVLAIYLRNLGRSEEEVEVWEQARLAIDIKARISDISQHNPLRSEIDQPGQRLSGAEGEVQHLRDYVAKVQEELVNKQAEADRLKEEAGRLQGDLTQALQYEQELTQAREEIKRLEERLADAENLRKTT
jgi:transcriptional regulator with XRE-family HTH domain